MSISTYMETGLTEIRTYIIGREGHIYLGDDSVSRQHAEITLVNNKIRVRDLNSTNGIYLLNGKNVTRIHEQYVEPDQPLMIGKNKCTVQELLDSLERTEMTYSENLVDRAERASL